VQDEDKIAAYGLDGASGRLTPLADVPAAGGPSVMALGRDRRTLYVGLRTEPAISSFRIDPGTGGLDPAGHFLFAARPASGRLASYRIEPGTGALTALAAEAVGQRPAAVLAVELDG
jgi:6-phosphogluconolactonase (cycloisomerase 2 family)